RMRPKAPRATSPPTSYFGPRNASVSRPSAGSDSPDDMASTSACTLPGDGRKCLRVDGQPSSGLPEVELSFEPAEAGLPTEGSDTLRGILHSSGAAIFSPSNW